MSEVGTGENGGYPPSRGSDPPGCQKVGGMKRFRHVVAKKILDKYWIEWHFGDRWGGYGTKSPPRGLTLPTSDGGYAKSIDHVGSRTADL